MAPLSETLSYVERREAHIRSFNDAEVLAEWEEAKRQDDGDPFGSAQMDLYDRIFRRSYFEDRKRARLRAEYDAARSKRRARAIEAGATAAYTVGRQVAAERARASLTQAELAVATGLPRTVIAKVERDARALSFAEACRFADALCVPLDRFRPTGPDVTTGSPAVRRLKELAAGRPEPT